MEETEETITHEGGSTRVQRERKAPATFERYESEDTTATKKRKSMPLKAKPKIIKPKAIDLKKSTAVKPLTGKLKIEDDLEEQFIRENPIDSADATHSFRSSSNEPQDISTIKEAIKYCVNKSSSLMLDWTTPQAKRVGLPIKVYWEGDEAWYYATILYYDQIFDRYFVSNCTYYWCTWNGS